MLTKQQKSEYRSTLFCHLDGIATATTAFALYKKGVLNYILKKKKVRLSELTIQYQANEGYLNVALRVLCSQGWLNQDIDNKNNTITYAVNEKSEAAFHLVHLYEDVVKPPSSDGQMVN